MKKELCQIVVQDRYRSIAGILGDAETPPVQVFFQGLAPGLAGYYQIDWRIPPDALDHLLSWYYGWYQLYCLDPSGVGLGGFLPVAI